MASASASPPLASQAGVAAEDRRRPESRTKTRGREERDGERDSLSRPSGKNASEGIGLVRQKESLLDAVFTKIFFPFLPNLIYKDCWSCSKTILKPVKSLRSYQRAPP